MLFRGMCGTSRLTVTRTAVSLTVGSDDRGVAACDLAGRLYSYWHDGHTFRRGLNGRVLHKWQVGAVRGREWLAVEDADRVVDAAAALFARALAARASRTWRWHPPVGPNDQEVLLAPLGAAASFDSAAARADAARFAQVYRPVGILPPDQYLALVLQATEGCSFGTCAFCELDADPYRVKSVNEFLAHVTAVRDYLGPSIRLRRRSIFLGAANALAAPLTRLLPILEIIARECGPPVRPVCAFVDALTGQRKTVTDYQALARLGLARVYVGLESGNDDLLALVGKPGTADDAVKTVRTLKAAGVAVGVIVMIGLGGEPFAGRHVEGTVRAVNRMGLAPGDQLYFSDLADERSAAYPALVRQHGLGLLGPDVLRDQRCQIRAGLRFPGAPPRIATYDIREFVY